MLELHFKIEWLNSTTLLKKVSESNSPWNEDYLKLEQSRWSEYTTTIKHGERISNLCLGRSLFEFLLFFFMLLQG